MVEFRSGKKHVDYRNSSKGFDDYIDKLNKQHPTDKTIFGDAYNYGMGTSVSDMHRQMVDEVHKEIAAVKKEQKKHMADMHRQQQDMRKGRPSGFIM